MTAISRLAALALPAFLSLAGVPAAHAESARAKGPLAIAPQYQTSIVYLAPEDFDNFVASLVATFGGTKLSRRMQQVSPTPSRALTQTVLTPVGDFSVRAFTGPIPYAFGTERVSFRVSDLDAAVASAKSHGIDIRVTNFPAPVGFDALVEWPGGLQMELQDSRGQPEYPELKTLPEFHVYVSAERSEAFVNALKEFADAKVVSDDRDAPGVDIGRPNEPYRRIRLESAFGKMTVLATDGQLPYPYGREIAGYQVADFDATLSKAQAAGATILVAPYLAGQRKVAMLQFPGGFVAEIHSSGK